MVNSTSTARIDGEVTVTGGDLTLNSASTTGDPSADEYGPTGLLLATDKNHISATAISTRKRFRSTPARTAAVMPPCVVCAPSSTRGQPPRGLPIPVARNRRPPGGRNLSGALAVGVSNNHANAIVGEGAVITVEDGDMSVTSRVEENIKVSVNALVNQPSETASGAAALFFGFYHNYADAEIGDDAVVDVSGQLKVEANSVIPNQVILDDDWDGFKEKFKGFVTPSGWIKPLINFELGEVPESPDTGLPNRRHQQDLVPGSSAAFRRGPSPPTRRAVTSLQNFNRAGRTT